jgi:hypothetical protein
MKKEIEILSLDCKFNQKLINKCIICFSIIDDSDSDGEDENEGNEGKLRN